MKRRDVKSKGEKDLLNAEFQRIARRDKKASLGNQCKEIEENNRMERLKISSSDGVIPRERYHASFHAKMGSVKDRNGMDLTEA